jgi:hypothetical protein
MNKNTELETFLNEGKISSHQVQHASSSAVAKSRVAAASQNAIQQTHRGCLIRLNIFLAQKLKSNLNQTLHLLRNYFEHYELFGIILNIFKQKHRTFLNNFKLI